VNDISLPIPLNQLVSLAIEHWRLSTALKDSPAQNAASIRHALRKIGDFLGQCHLECRSLDGLPYDAGMNASVIDTIHNPALPQGSPVVAETLSPMVLYQGSLYRPAEVVVAANAPTQG
jgi:hypothetical protein